MFRALNRLLGTVHEHPGTAPAAVSLRLDALESRLKVVEGAELERAAEHAERVSRLESLYKRFTARQTRERQREESGGESVLELRERLRGRRGPV